MGNAVSLRLLLLVKFLCLSSLALISCHEEKPRIYSCVDGNVDFELFNDELNPQAYLNHPGTAKLDYKIIQDESVMYEMLYIVYLKKKIDFKSKSLIVISVNAGDRAYVVNQNVQAECSTNKLNIEATLKYGSAPIDGASYVFLIVPKLPSNTIIEFDPTYIN